MKVRVMMLGPYPRNAARIDGGVAAATMYISESLSALEDVELICVRIAGRSSEPATKMQFDAPVVDLELVPYSVSTLFVRQRRLLGDLVAEHRPDIIHAQGADASGYLAVRSSVPAVVTIHGILTECAKLETNPVRKLRETVQAGITEKLVVERARHVITISPYVSRHYAGRIGAQTYAIPNPVASKFFALERRPERGRILYAGRIARGKGLLDLVRATKSLTGSIGKVILAGACKDPTFERKLRSVISGCKLDETYEMTGLLEEGALLKEFSRASILVLPSYQETAPMVIQQALAAGLPVVASRVGGVPDLIEHGKTGLLHDPGSVPQLAACIESLMADEVLNREVALAGRLVATTNFTSHSVAAKTKSVYDRVLARSI